MSLSKVEIHPSSVVHPAARIGSGTRIGAFCVIDADVQIGQNCEIQDHVVIRSFTKLGDEVKVFPFAVLGSAPQHLKYAGEPTVLEIGNRVTLRESVTLHRGTVIGRGATTIGDDTYLMAYTHVAHDCIVGKSVLIANSTQLAGHAEIGDYAVVGGQTAVPQFLRVGAYCFIGGASVMRKDLPPFLSAKGDELSVVGVNSIGLERRGFSPESISRLKKLYRIFYLQHRTVAQAVEQAITELGETGEVKTFLDFVRTSKMGITR